MTVACSVVSETSALHDFVTAEPRTLLLSLASGAVMGGCNGTDNLADETLPAMSTPCPHCLYAEALCSVAVQEVQTRPSR